MSAPSTLTEADKKCSVHELIRHAGTMRSIADRCPPGAENRRWYINQARELLAYARRRRIRS